MDRKVKIRDFLRLNPQSKTPKYRQIIHQVIEELNRSVLSRGDLLPSINEVCEQCGLSRDTVVKAYRHLKQIGVLKPVHGKGFYVDCDAHRGEKRVFMLFDELATPYKTCLYNAIKNGVEGQADLDVYFHHYNPELTVRLIRDAVDNYEYYVVMTYDNEVIKPALTELDQDKLLILDQFNDFPGRRCAVIQQDFVEQQAKALGEVAASFRKYESVILVFPKDGHHPLSVKRGFRRFCRTHHIEGHVVSRLHPGAIEKNQAYFVIEDDDLVTLVKYRRANRLRAGKDIGILSYNEVPFKEVIDNGITVISTDFADMGQLAAQQILNPVPLMLVCPTRIIKRQSL